MGLRLLIIDDSPAMRTFIRRVIALSGVETESIAEAANGKDALESLACRQVDVILCDINMPVMNGEQFLSELTQHPEFKGIPVVVVSTDSTTASVGRTRHLGAAAYVRKPFTPEMLRDALEFAVTQRTRSGGLRVPLP